MGKKWLILIFSVVIIIALSILLADAAIGAYAWPNPDPPAPADLNCASANYCTEQRMDYENLGNANTDTKVPSQATETKTCAASETKSAAAAPCDHCFGDGQVVVEATTDCAGLETRTCLKCGDTETQEIPQKTVKNNSLWIPSANLSVNFVLTDLNQNNVDTYDAVCDLHLFPDYFGSNDIIISGHRTKAIGGLYQTVIGDNLTLNIDGVYSTYTVVVSEEATPTAAENDLTGVSTGISFMTSTYAEQALRIYTCYNEERWIVIALLLP